MQSKFFKFKPRLRWKNLAIALFMLFTLTLSSLITIRLYLARTAAPNPQAILILEGNTDRIKFGAQFAERHPNLPIWVSGNRRGQARNQVIFQRSGIPAQQVFYDFCAVDTVTNFTCNVPALTERQIQHVYLITSDYHMHRSVAIATFVFGSQGITVTPVSVTSAGEPPESIFRVLRDCIRSIIWIVTGWTGVGEG
jgi:uncharacterized SAM-binding protein YcdF (DUF218 family)